MINSKALQNSYIDLYKAMREYVWPMSAVSKLVDVEIESHKAFPDVSKLKFLINSLKSEVTRRVDDDSIDEAFSEFTALLNSSDEVYTKLLVPVEVN